MSRRGYTPKRKSRSLGPPRRPLVKRRITGYSGSRKWRPGYDRTGGYYGIQNQQLRRMKFHDVDLSDAVVAIGVNVTPSINLIPQGVTENTRVGQSCLVKKIGWKFEVQLAETLSIANTSDVIRVIMYLDKQCNGATAASTDILESANFQSFNNLANKGRFRTLMDRTYSLHSVAGAGNSNTSYGRISITDEFHKKCSINLNFDSTDGALTEIRSNNIGVLLISSLGLGGFTSKIRLRFMDNDA